MTIHKSLLGHGIFTEFSVANALKRFEKYISSNPANPPPKDDIDRFVYALKDMDISTVWIQLFSRGGDLDKKNPKRRKDLIDRLGTAGINWAGWGYCAGRNAERDVKLIESLRDDLDMKAFVIDAEPGNKVWPNPNDPNKKLPDLWTIKEFEDFVKSVNALFGKDNLGLSTWPILQIQNDKKNPVIDLMRAAEPYVCLFAPQAYWMSFPKKIHYDLGYKEIIYPRDNPESYVRLVIQTWRDLKFMGPLVVSGQSYWGESSPSMERMNDKTKSFIADFKDWSKIVGFNWYHAGGKNTADEGSMSDDMVAAIVAGKLGGKPYAAPP